MLQVLKRKIFLIAGAFLLCVLAIGWGELSSEPAEPEGSNGPFCWGALTGNDVDLLVDESADRYLSQATRSSDLAEYESKCFVHNPSFDESYPVVKVEVGSPIHQWPYGVQAWFGSVRQYLNYAPLGNGLNGWTSRSGASVWLPDKCSEKSGSGEPIQLSLRLDGSRWDTVAEEKVRFRHARALGKLAGKVTDNLGCKAESFSEEKFLEPSKGGNGSSFDSQETCSLGGFSPFSSSGAGQGVKQRVVSDSRMLWSCILTKDRNSFVGFSMTQHPQLIDEFSREKRKRTGLEESAKILRCGGNETLVQMEYPDETSDEDEYALAGKLLKDEREMFEEFISAARQDLGCSSG